MQPHPLGRRRRRRRGEVDERCTRETRQAVREWGRDAHNPVVAGFEILPPLLGSSRSATASLLGGSPWLAKILRPCGFACGLVTGQARVDDGCVRPGRTPNPQWCL